jgi:hypothetical protein
LPSNILLKRNTISQKNIKVAITLTSKSVALCVNKKSM